MRAYKSRVLRENIWTENKESRRVEKVYVRSFLTSTLRRILRVLRRRNGEMIWTSEILKIGAKVLSETILKM
jgi:hypothetical protein